MTTPSLLDPTTIPTRVLNALPLPVVEAFHQEAKQIKAAETQLHLRRVVLVTKLREKGMSWDSCGWFFGATGEAVRKFYGSLLGDQPDSDSDSGARGRPDVG